MVQKGINVLDIKKQNRKQILMILKNYGALSRKDISTMLNLTAAAVTIITNEMLEEGVLVEIGEQIETDKRAGRKKILIDINYNLKYIVGVSIESESVSIGLCNLKGEAIDSIQIDISYENKTSDLDILKLISNNCMNLLWKNNIQKQSILGLGVGIIGPVDTSKGISINAYGIFKENIPIKDILEGLLDIPVCIDNNVRALAMAEIDLTSPEKNKNNMIFVKYGPGIGAAIIIDNEIYNGSNNNAGELGHTIVKPYGELCKCGKRGCLESISSPSAVFTKIKKIFASDSTPHLYKITGGNMKNINLLNIIESAENGDNSIIDVIDEAIFYFAMALSTAVTLYDPKQVVFYGELLKYKFFVDKLKFYFKDFVANDKLINIIGSSDIEYNHKFLGGIALALRKFFYNQGGKY